MKHPVRKTYHTSGLIGLGLSAMIAGPAAALDFSQDMESHLSILGPWKAYALQTITPSYARLMPEIAGTYPAHPPSSLPGSALLADLDLMLPMSNDNHSGLVFSFQDRHAPILTAATESTSHALLSDQGGWAINQQMFSSGIRHQMSEQAWWQISAVVASQRFRLFENGVQYSNLERDQHALGSLDTPSYGAGLRFVLEGRILPRFSLGLNYQTRIDMDALTTYRGLFNKPADFDIPAHASVLLKLHASSRQTITLEAQRIQYSQVDPFNSYLLPDRFTSLLGDGGSPEFNWNDLTVYNVNWNWQPQENWQLDATWGTGNQPSPTSSLLYQALVPDYARQNLNLSVAFNNETLGTVSLAMRYAQPEPLYQNLMLSRNHLRDRLAVELNWSLSY